MKNLKISPTGHYFTLDDKPFPWLADTVWTLPQRMKWDDVRYLMEKRKSQGYTVLQIVALDPERDQEMRNPSGEKALINDCLDTPNEGYFCYLDRILDMAEEYGFYILLLPVWGQLVVGDDWGGRTFEKTVTEENAFRYGEWIGNRYKNRNNILWCLGGDRQPIHKGKDFRNVWRRMAEGLAKGVTGISALYNEPSPAWDQLLITYHSCYEMETGECSTLSYWDDTECWIRFVMLQSGHGTEVKNYDLVAKEYTRPTVRPVWDGEPAYEQMPTSWPPRSNAFHGAYMVRKRAYWSLFAGAFGYTYGHASVWCSISEKEKNALSPYSWFEALDQEGARQMRYVRAVMEDLETARCLPAQNIILDLPKQQIQESHCQACIHPDGKYICVYLPMGGEIQLGLNNSPVDFSQRDLYMWWFNPKNGQFYTTDNTVTDAPISIHCDGDILSLSAPEIAEMEDWILILHTQETEPPVKDKIYYEMEEDDELAKVFDWKD